MGYQFFATPGNFFLHFSYYCIIIVVKEKSPEITDELNLGLCDALESSIFSCTHIIHLIATTYDEISSKICTV